MTNLDYEENYFSPEDFLICRGKVSKVNKCLDCKGIGYIELNGERVLCVCLQRRCPYCLGNGMFGSELTCWYCDGHGYQVYLTQKQMSKDIKEGVREKNGSG